MNTVILDEFLCNFLERSYCDESSGAQQFEPDWIGYYYLLGQIHYGNIPGDIVEIGCNRGYTSAFIRLVLDYYGSTRKLYLYDSFSGMPEHGDGDEGTCKSIVQPGSLKASPEEVLELFAAKNLPEPNITVGWVADIKPQQLPEQIAFALIDVDLYEPILDSLRLVYPRVSPGGIIAIDDYSLDQLIPGTKRATDEFFADKPEKPQPVWRSKFAYVRKQ